MLLWLIHICSGLEISRNHKQIEMCPMGLLSVWLGNPMNGLFKGLEPLKFSNLLYFFLITSVI